MHKALKPKKPNNLLNQTSLNLRRADELVDRL